jgi:sugar diacid utilization regulator
MPFAQQTCACRRSRGSRYYGAREQLRQIDESRLVGDRQQRTRTGTAWARALLLQEPPSPNCLQLLAQRAAIDAENARGTALISLRVVEDHAKQGLLDLAQHQLVELRRADGHSDS